jgi:Fe-S-cluster containining protein
MSRGTALVQIQKRLKLLKKIYDIYDGITLDAKAKCHKGCSACCTCNVTATTMEGLLIYDYFVRRGKVERLRNIIETAPPSRFLPRVTINQMAALCADGKELPDETNDPSAGNCTLLDDDCCSLYPVRPFGCRAMFSSSDCRLSGEAQMPPFMLSVNNVIMQYLEAVDLPGGTGNLIDVLSFLSAGALCEAYLGGLDFGGSHGLLVNRPFRVLMVPFEHRQSIRPLIQSLGDAVQSFQ